MTSCLTGPIHFQSRARITSESIFGRRMFVVDVDHEVIEPCWVNQRSSRLEPSKQLAVRGSIPEGKHTPEASQRGQADIARG